LELEQGLELMVLLHVLEMEVLQILLKVHEQHVCLMEVADRDLHEQMVLVFLFQINIPGNVNSILDH
jgi:hypothetical protein